MDHLLAREERALFLRWLAEAWPGMEHKPDSAYHSLALRAFAAGRLAVVDHERLIALIDEEHARRVREFNDPKR